MLELELGLRGLSKGARQYRAHGQGLTDAVARSIMIDMDESTGRKTQAQQAMQAEAQCQKESRSGDDDADLRERD